jgi:hypothetical protein
VLFGWRRRPNAKWRNKQRPFALVRSFARSLSRTIVIHAADVTKPRSAAHAADANQQNPAPPPQLQIFRNYVSPPLLFARCSKND